jgi:methionine-rich copper-binding protein CopC
MKKIFALSLALLVLIPGAPAFAHAQLTGATPKANAVLTKSPTQIKLTFDDDLIALESSNKIEVTNTNGKRVDANNSSVLGNQLTVTLKKLVAGKYKVSYRVLSADGHPVAATYSFTIGKQLSSSK